MLSGVARGGVAREIGTVCPLVFFFLYFMAVFGPIWGQSMWRGWLWCCDVFRCFKGLGPEICRVDLWWIF